MTKILLLFQCIILASVSAQAQKTAPKPVEIPVTFSRGEATYSGTLALPAGSGKHPLVILVSGMGPQDRDWTFFNGKYKLAKMLSDSLNNNGIAVLRYDDRGTGKSGGTPETLTSFADLADDVYAAVTAMRNRREIGKIGLLGHSLGGLLSVMAAAKHSDIDFIVTLAGSYQNGGEIMMEQAHTLKRWRTSKEMTEAAVVANGERFVRNWVAYAQSGTAGLDTVRSIVHDLIAFQIRNMSQQDMEQNLKQYKDTAQMLRQVYQEALDYYTSPHQQSFALYDPAVDLKQVACPVLVLFGEKDAHVTVRSNMPKVAQALNGARLTDFSLYIVPGADHAFITEASRKYWGIAPGLCRYIAQWVQYRK